MMKKVVTLLLAVWLVFLVAACGTHPPDPTEEATAGWIFPEDKSNTRILLRKNSPSIQELHNRYILFLSLSKQAPLINVA